MAVCLRKIAPLASALPRMQQRGIYGRINREIQQVPPRSAPFPYLEKTVSLYRSIIEPTLWRFDDNSKLIVLDGPPASGKTQLAKQLADDLDMKHFPEVTMDDYYVNSYGYDLRQLDDQLPVDARSFDHTGFCINPKHWHAGRFQLMTYTLRFAQYLDALAHVLNTGQGAILERSPFSDFVFMEAMYECEFVRKAIKAVYYEVKGMTIQELLRPHLVIYLDVPVPIVKDRIKKRDLPHERNSPALTDKFLSTVERHYKESYLKIINTHSEVLVYDWSDYGDTEVVIEDIERIDFDSYNTRDTKCKDWKFENGQDAADHRRKFTNRKSALMNFFAVYAFDIPELTISGIDDFERNEIYSKAPGMAYTYGYNEDMGDTNVLTKTQPPRHTTILHC